MHYATSIEKWGEHSNHMLTDKRSVYFAKPLLAWGRPGKYLRRKLFSRTSKLKIRYIFLCFAITMALVLAFLFNNTSTMNSIITPYPKSPSAQESSEYHVTVNGQSVPVEKYNSISYVRFAFAGEADVEVNVSEPVNNYTLSPKSYNIPSSKNGDKISFSLSDPRKLILHNVNSSGEKLFILADPLEENSPRVGDSNVTNIMNYGVDITGGNDATARIQKAIEDVSSRQGILYFPPGVYKTKQLNLKSNMTLYLSSGAEIEGTKEINPSFGQGLLNLENVNNVKIMGRGVINGNGSYWRPRGGWYSLIRLSNNVLLQDVVIKDPAVANVWTQYSENLKVENVKILADPKDFINTDGFDFWSSRNITVDNVLYKGSDDATSMGGDKKTQIQNNENINIKNSVFYAGGSFKIGTTAEQDFIRNITYENIDVVYTDGLIGLFPVTRANFENIYFKNIRVEDILDAPRGYGSSDLFQFRVMVASWEPTSSPNNLGYIRNVYIDNLIANDRGSINSIFQGYDAQHDIRNVNFNNLYVDGKVALNPSDAHFDILNQYVDLKFTKSDPTIVNITAKDLFVPAGATSQFEITRTGNTNQPLTLNYDILGTAINGIDYQTIPNSIVIPPGASSATVNIQSNHGNISGGLESVFLRLDNLPNSTNYLLGSNFQAAINIFE
jgi:Glycosyl hydrolases family 28